MYENEIWRPVTGYENLYEVSNLGRVKSVERYDSMCRLWKCKILKPIIVSGYNRIVLSKNGIKKQYSVHRLVAQAFIPNHDNLPVINHINEVKTDNRVENLEWVTHKENLEYSGNIEKWNKSGIESKKKPVIQLTKNNEFVAEYESTMESARKTGINQRCISGCCLGKLKSAGGYKWKFKIDYEQEQRAND